MATQCRESKKKPKRNFARLYTAFLVIALLGGLIGYAIGAVYTPQKTVTVTETIEVPVHESENLPQDTEVFLFDIPLSDSLQRYIYEICADEGVPVTLALAMIEHESGFNPEVISSTDDYGLMQINAINHECGLRKSTESLISLTHTKTHFAVSPLSVVTSRSTVITARL